MDAEVDHLSPSLSIWHRYDPVAKVDVFSSRLAGVSVIHLVDPIPLPAAAFETLLQDGDPARIVLTNGNHARAAEDFSRRLRANIYAHPDARVDLQSGSVKEAIDINQLTSDLMPITIDGAAPGEIALYCEAEGGTLILGDALINMDSLGFTFLPAKYCANPKQMRKSLQKLLDYSFERMLFAHGMPIVSRAKSRLADLLTGGSQT